MVTRSILAATLALVFTLPVVLAGCAGSEEKMSKPPGDMSEPQDQPSGNRARDLYDEMLDEEQEDLDELLDD